MIETIVKFYRLNIKLISHLKHYSEMRLVIPSFVLSMLILLWIPLGLKSQPSQSPNIIVILPDDLGWNDVGYHGSFIKTPNMDQLVAEGAHFSQHYVTPSCSHSRVSLITGKYPSRYGILAPAYGEVIDEGDPTLASLLRDLGYLTAISGKWHMGSPPFTPLKYGFASSYGYFDGQ